MVDISKSGSRIVITLNSDIEGSEGVFYPKTSCVYRFKLVNDILCLVVSWESMLVVPFTQLTVAGVAPGDEAAAKAALETVFLDSGDGSAVWGSITGDISAQTDLYTLLFMQPDWTQSDSTAIDYIKHKPVIPAAQVQSDWNEANNLLPDFIKNKPSIPAAFPGTDNGVSLDVGTGKYGLGGANAVIRDTTIAGTGHLFLIDITSQRLKLNHTNGTDNVYLDLVSGGSSFNYLNSVSHNSLRFLMSSSGLTLNAGKSSGATNSVSFVMRSSGTSIWSGDDSAGGGLHYSISVDAYTGIVLGGVDSSNAIINLLVFLQQLPADASPSYMVTIDNTTGQLKKSPVGGGGASFAGVRVNQATNQSIAAVTETALTFVAENYDTDAYHDNVTNNTRLTVPAGKAGYYDIGGFIGIQKSALDYYVSHIRLNGSTEIGNDSALGTYVNSELVYLNVGTQYFLNVGDYVELTIYHSATGGLSLNANPAQFWMAKIG